MEFLWECMTLSIKVFIGGLAWTSIGTIIVLIFGAILGIIGTIKN